MWPQVTVTVNEVAQTPDSLKSREQPRYNWTREFVDNKLPALVAEARKEEKDRVDLFSAPRPRFGCGWDRAFITQDAVHALNSAGFNVRHATVKTKYDNDPISRESGLIVLNLSENKEAVARLTKHKNNQIAGGENTR